MLSSEMFRDSDQIPDAG